MYNGKVKRYKADQGKSVYLENREHSTRRYRVFETAPFLEYVVKQFKNEHWSLDAIFGYALHNELFKREEMVCTKTLYNYVSLGLLPIKNIDLPEKLKRNTAKSKATENKKKLGRSIEERPESVEPVSYTHLDVYKRQGDVVVRIFPTEKDDDSKDILGMGMFVTKDNPNDIKVNIPEIFECIPDIEN